MINALILQHAIKVFALSQKTQMIALLGMIKIKEIWTAKLDFFALMKTHVFLSLKISVMIQHHASLVKDATEANALIYSL